MENGKEKRLTEISDEEAEEYRAFRTRTNTFETGLNREERLFLNIMHSKMIEKMEKERLINENK